MKRISEIRFDALAGYCRQPLATVTGQELAWFESESGRLLGFVLMDRFDRDFSGMVLARDARECFRWVDATDWLDTPDAAAAALADKMDTLEALPREKWHQGDEVGPPIDFFAPRAPDERLNPSFLQLARSVGYSPARGIIEPMMRWYGDRDGNFIEQFQTTGFDARIFELYLFAVFIEAGYAISEKTAVPDFTCSRFGDEFCIEATTVGPSRNSHGEIVPPPPLDTAEQVREFQREYMPIRFAGALTKKLQKRYWEHANVGDKPLLLAVEDFHAPGSLLVSRAALPIYLYGQDHSWTKNERDELVITPIRVDAHRWGNKVVPSGFFSLEGAENISAVIFTNAGTIAKFNRMGVLAGFGDKKLMLVREGKAVDLNPNATEPVEFIHHVNSEGYSESWVEGVDVYHNPRALRPLDPYMLAGAAHHRLREDGQVESIGPDWQPLVSTTTIIEFVE